MIEFSHVSKLFGAQKAVNDLNLNFQEGSFSVLIGTSGSGKSTTLKMINRLVEHDSGEIRFAGEEIRSLPVLELRRRMGYAIQSIGLFPHWSVAQNIATVPQLQKWSRARIDDRIDELMALLGLESNLRERYPHQLSGGQQQRVGVARALIWMILAAFVGMATKFAEIALGIKYRKVHEDGTVSGGAMYYLSEGLHQKWLGILFSILVIPFAFVISGVVDTNTIALTLNERYSVPTLVTGIVLAVVVGIIVFGGIGRIGHVCEVVAPFMGGAYILAGLLIIIVHITEVPHAIAEILIAAFNPRAATGGIVGSIFVCMRYGIARGIYSNEAGLGTAAMVHCGAKVNDPIEQAVWGPVEVFLDTVFICSVTGIAIVLSGLWNSGLDGAVLTMRAFDQLLPGGIGGFICLASVVLFGFSCLISYYTYAERAGEYIFGQKIKPIIKALWVVIILIGSQSTLGFAWDLADTFNGLMIIPNLIGIILLSNEAVKMKNDYFKRNNVEKIKK